MAEKGKVYIIGVGPGDYKLITLKAKECIEKADVIVYDRLVNGKILSFAKEGAEFIYVGKLPDHHAVPQEGINAILVDKAREGKTVARVKGGDPFVFGRGGEEAETLYDSGIEFEIVPGVTSAIAVPAYAGIPVTHRDFCSSLHIITGHERPDKDSSLVDYEVLAKLPGTLVFLMGVKNLGEISSKLIKYGKSRDTAAAVIEKGTTIEQRVVSGTLEGIYDKVLKAGIKSPAVTVIGSVAGLGEKLKWFSKGPLAGKRVIVTRAREQASKLAERIEELGGEALEYPSIKIAETEDLTLLDNILGNISEFNWIVFTSTNGVRAFIRRIRDRRMDIRALAGIRLCAVGAATAGELTEAGLIADFVPERFTTADLLDGLISKVKPNEKVLLARADIANPGLAEGLKERNIDLTDLAVYKTLPVNEGRDELVQLLKDKKVDFITFTSSSTVKNLVNLLGEENKALLSGTRLVCIGAVTAKTAEEHGLKVSATADVYTIEGLVSKLIEMSIC